MKFLQDSLGRILINIDILRSAFGGDRCRPLLVVCNRIFPYANSDREIVNYSCLIIELRQVFLAMKVFQAKYISSLFKMTITYPSKWNYYILLHETYTNLDRLAVQFLLQPRETAPSSTQAFTDKLSAFFVQFSRLIDPFKSLSITCPQFWQW